MEDKMSTTSIKDFFNAKTLSRFVRRNNIFLPFFLLLGVLICMHNQFDFLWDFANYHYYNAWNFWENPKNLTLYMPPAGMNTFLNPLLDIPLYLLIKYFNDFPQFIYAVQGLWFGALLFLFWKTGSLFFNKDNYQSLIGLTATVVIAATSHCVWFQAGSSTNEIQISVLSVFCLYFLLKYIVHPELQRSLKYFALGLIFGMTLGLKQTCISYAFGSGITLILCNRFLRRPLSFIILYAIGGLLGFLIVDGYFMYQNYQQYGNPFLPAFTSTLSPLWFGYRSLIDLKYIPKGWMFLYYPYVMEDKAAELTVSDKRFIIYYTLFIIFFIFTLINYIRRRPNTFFTNKLNIFSVVFLAISYVIWINIFGILRYFIIIELFSTIFTVKILLHFIPKTEKMEPYYWGFAIILLYIFVATTQYSFPWFNIRDKNSEKFLSVEPLSIPQEALVVFNAQPTAFLLQSLCENNAHIHAILDHSPAPDALNHVPLNLLYQKRDEIRRKFGDNIVFIFPENIRALIEDEEDGIFSAKSLEFHRIKRKMKCHKIQSNIQNNYHICYARTLKNIPPFEEEAEEEFEKILNLQE